MKRKILPAALLVIAAFMLLQTGCSHDEKPDETSVTSAETAAETETERLPERIWDEFEEMSRYESGVISEEIFHPEGFLVSTFYAEYPVLSENDDANRKISTALEDFCRDKLEKVRELDAAAGYDENGEINEYFADFHKRGAVNDHRISYHIDTDSSSIFSVCFTYFPNYAGAAPVYVYPTAMAFGMRTGERIDFESLIADKEGFAEAMEYAFGRETDSYHEDFVFGYTGDGSYVIGGNPVSERVAVRNGAIGFYFGSGESGTGRSALSTYFAGLPAEDVLEYLTDEGRALFEM